MSDISTSIIPSLSLKNLTSHGVFKTYPVENASSIAGQAFHVGIFP
jgi:hypothetical protein